ncbi:hypothetical protein LCGC14_0856360 [marine sediment metagenome]|uniref:Uncharacterized protein n=1 Tax=marine sediment metagenome TaxID=412755 RepID=A0A0F9RTC0_9ZZZZ
MPKAAKAIQSKKPKRLDSETHHCSQCNRPTLHEVYEHEDGVTMKCPCGYKFVDVRVSAEVKEEIE